MGNLDKFSEKIQDRLSRQDKEKGEKLLRLDKQMQEMLAKRERFNNMARHMLTSVIEPRMRELTRHFDNSTLEKPGQVAGFQSGCVFSPTDRFPAKVILKLSITSSEYFEHMELHYSLGISPALLKFKRYDSQAFNLESPTCEEEICRWVEVKILDFIETYLQLETHPEYQKDRFVVDPVCDMRFPVAQAAAMVEKDGRAIYFCSEACREEFLKNG